MFEFVIILQQLVSSTSHIVAKNLTQSVHPSVVLLFRLGLASLMYGAWIFFRRKKQVFPGKRDMLLILLLGLFNATNQFLFLTSISLTAAPNVALAYAMTPAFVLIIAVSFTSEKATMQKVIGVIIAFAGSIFLILENGFDINSDGTLGNILAFVASMSFAMYTVVGKRIATEYGAFFSTGGAMISGLFFYAVMFSIFGEGLDITPIGPANWAQIAFLAFGTSGLGYALWYLALKMRDASKVAVFNNLQPLFTTIMSIIFFAHELTLFFVIGGLLIVGGVITTQKG